jgi:hypothetical protein
MALYGKPVCNLIGLPFDSGPLARLIVVTTSERHRVTPKKDDDITFRNAVVASYADFGRMGGDHDFAANRLRRSPAKAVSLNIS